MAHFTVYSVSGCKHCRAAKHVLGELQKEDSNIHVRNVDVSNRRDVRSALGEALGKNYMTVPQIFLNKQYIGGNSELQEKHENGELTNSIKAAREEPFEYDSFPYPLPEEDEGADEEMSEVPINEEEWLVSLLAKWALTEVIGNRDIDEVSSDGIIERPFQDYQQTLHALFNSETECTAVLRTFVRRGILWSKKQQSFDDMSKKCKIAFLADYVRGANVSKENATKIAASFKSTILENGEADQEQSGCSYAKQIIAPISTDEEKHQKGKLDESVMNFGYVARGPSKDASSVSIQIRQGILDIFDSFMSSEGNLDYGGIRNSSEFDHFKKLTGTLQLLNLDGLSEQELIAFFINIYNALVIHGYIQYGIPTNTLKRISFFENVSYKIGPYVLSLGDIEHGVMRKNRTAPYSFFSRKRFSDNDARIDLVNQISFDPRVHFALVCGAKSCPPLKVFSGENLNDELNEVGRAFLNDKDNLEYDSKSQKLYLNQIFNWYHKDFGDNDDEFVRFLLQFLNPDDKKSEIEEAVDSKKKITMKYNEYDWGVNGTD